MTIERSYTDEVNVQILISLLKSHGIKRVIASPGTTNMAFVASIQYDEDFDVFSVVDERSAAYVACGLAAEKGEPVVLSCTGATASRNYASALTEAYYRKLPVLAITSTRNTSKIGHLEDQVIDRSVIQRDIAKLSVTLPIVKDDSDIWDCEIKVNKAILELKRHGGGPVHINLPTTYSRNFNVKTLPSYKVIKRYTTGQELPELNDGKIAIFIGSHYLMNSDEVSIIDAFCATNDAVVFCDHTSGYNGKYKVLYPLVSCQKQMNHEPFRPDLLIHIGEITGSSFYARIAGTQVWRVSQDGEIRDTFGKLQYVFEMSEFDFFKHYTLDGEKKKHSYLDSLKEKRDEIFNQIPELPLSNIWIASKLSSLIPKGSNIHFGILNSLRSWNFFEVSDTINLNCNVGGFGIDGGLSSLVGASLANANKLYFGFIGDLAFFYDMNVLGNRHVGSNIRILLVNNGRGVEFRQYNHVASQFDESGDEFIAAAGHFGNKSKDLVRHYARDLGFEYLSASTQDEFLTVYKRFVSSDKFDKPIVFEVFTTTENESYALECIMNIDRTEKASINPKTVISKVVGAKGKGVLKKIIGKK